MQLLLGQLALPQDCELGSPPPVSCTRSLVFANSLFRNSGFAKSITLQVELIAFVLALEALKSMVFQVDAECSRAR